ncbi:MAG: hypothetical protein BWK80_34925 [Desulfobacteraceae bacterium IS3]|nr:MAG: hypothetical protein BWK80_34925 [Desulfobacteraceae bacterium IS3]
MNLKSLFFSCTAVFGILFFITDSGICGDKFCGDNNGKPLLKSSEGTSYKRTYAPTLPQPSPPKPKSYPRSIKEEKTADVVKQSRKENPTPLNPAVIFQKGDEVKYYYHRGIVTGYPEENAQHTEIKDIEDIENIDYGIEKKAGVCGDSCCDGSPLSSGCGVEGGESSREDSYSSLPVIINTNPRTSINLTRSELNEIIINDVLIFCPPAMREYLATYRNIILNGINFSHRTKAKLSPDGVAECYKNLVAGLKTGNPDEYTLKSFGLIADAVSCAVYPGKICHGANYMPLIIRYDGHNDVPDIAELIKNLQTRDKIPCRDKDKERIEELYHITLNGIIDCWISAWTKAGYAADNIYAPGKIYEHKAELE